MSTAAQENFPGTGEMLGEYRIVQELGRGGCGVVFEALQVRLNRTVGLKVVPIGEGGAFAGVGERFKREVDLVRRLEHPNIVRLYDFGEEGTEVLWMAMELVDGPELMSLMRDDGRMDPERVKHIALQLLSGLAAAHEIDVVHRDLKPSNIMLTRKGADEDVVKILDFGIGKAIGKAEDKELQELTGAHGDLIGTPRYMAPEVLKGDALGAFSDVYAVGLILFEMLTGLPAVDGATVYEVCAQQIYHDLRMPSWFEASPWGPIIKRATQKRPADRFTSALEFHQAVKNISITDAEIEALIELGREGKLDMAEEPDLKLPPSLMPPPLPSSQSTASDPPRSGPPVEDDPPPPDPGNFQSSPGLVLNDDDPAASGTIELNELHTGPVPEDALEEMSAARPPWLVPVAIAAAIILVLVVVLVSAGGDEPTGETADTSSGDDTEGPNEMGGVSAGAGDDSNPAGDSDSTGEEGPTEGAVGGNVVPPPQEVADNDMEQPNAETSGDASDTDETAPNEPGEAVTWAFTSSPRGAKVIAGGAEVCASTPCEAALPRADAAVRVRFTRRGYREASTEIIPTADGTFNAKLRKKRRDKSGGDKDDDPFNVRSFD